MKHALLLPFLLAMPGLAGAEIYRSVDAQGRVTFSQMPPEGREAQKVEPRVAPANPAEAQALRKQMETIDKGRADAGKKQVETEAKAKAAAERCAKAQEAAQALERSRPKSHYYSTNAQGQREYWSEERRIEEQAKAQQTASKVCSES